MKKDSTFFRLTEELADLDRRLFGAQAGVDEAGAAECGDSGMAMPATMGELHLVYKLFQHRDSILQQLSRLPSPMIPGSKKGRIPWRRSPEYLRCLLKALIENGYIANTSVEAIRGHFDAKAPAPTELIAWKNDYWTIGAFLAALADAGCTGPLTRSTNPRFPRPRGAPRWAAEHFGMKEKSFAENCRAHKASSGGAVATFTHLLHELKIA